jgi:multidrug efflux pump subunit AcrA (membrane-fusion protein)
MKNNTGKEHFLPIHLKEFVELAKLTVPSSLKILIRLIKGSVLLVILIMTLVPWVQTAPGSGSLTALNPDDRAQHVNAFVSGRIKHWFVREGSAVKKGDPLVEIADNDSLLIERLANERNALQQNYDVVKIAAETSKLNYVRQEDLFNSGLSSRRDFENSKITYKSHLAKESKALAGLNQAEIKLSRQATQTLYAPRDGTIVRIVAGDIATAVKEGQPMATFVPSGVDLAVELFVSGIDIPLIQPGKKVRLQFEGWPVIQFSGWPSKAIGTFGGVVKVIDPVVAEKGKFRIIVVPDYDDEEWPDERFLRLGSKAKGWVLLETVKIGYELWRQLNSFPPENIYHNVNATEHNE